MKILIFILKYLIVFAFLVKLNYNRCKRYIDEKRELKWEQKCSLTIKKNDVVEQNRTRDTVTILKVPDGMRDILYTPYLTVEQALNEVGWKLNANEEIRINNDRPLFSLNFLLKPQDCVVISKAS